MTSQRPVIVGVGQSVNNATDQSQPEPVDLAVDAIISAFDDAGLSQRAMPHVDSLDAVNVLSWRYGPDFAGAIAKRLGIAPEHCAESPVGGQQPIAILDRMSAEITAGERRFGIICGAEAQATLVKAKRARRTVPWPTKPDRPSGADSLVKHIVHPELWRHGLRFPIQIYPLFENAYRARRGCSVALAQRDSARMWASMSEVAVQNPYALQRIPHTATEIATPSKANRWVFYPYTKLMNAAPNVDQGAAALVLDEDFALSLGISADKFVYPTAGAGAIEISDPLQRVSFDRSVAMESTLDAVVERSGVPALAFDSIELYSCFPVVPKMASNHLELDDRAVTVAGGLSFFGGPGNNYMLHAVASMVGEIRRRGTRTTGLAYGQGEYLTKHHAVTLSGERPASPYADGTTPLESQRDIDANRFTHITASPAGPATVETFTASWNPADGSSSALAIGRLISTGERFVARSDDPATVQTLTSGEVEGVGLKCYVTASPDFNRFRIG